MLFWYPSTAYTLTTLLRPQTRSSLPHRLTFLPVPGKQLSSFFARQQRPSYRRHIKMVFVDGIKFSCEPCIKGHRSAHCLHPDRPLFEVKREWSLRRYHAVSLLIASSTFRRQRSSQDAVSNVHRAPRSHRRTHPMRLPQGCWSVRCSPRPLNLR